MKAIIKKIRSRKAFTIVELLTIMSIIIILISLLVPALNKISRFAKNVKQRAQFHSIGISMDLFNVEYEGYPESGPTDGGGNPYCGAMKIAEAMIGWDGRGFQHNSDFRAEGHIDDGGVYDPFNLSERKEYLPSGRSDAYKLEDLYTVAEYGTKFTAGDGKMHVLCDVFGHIINNSTGRRIGKPILYYKANISNINDPYYDSYRDNDVLVHLDWADIHPIDGNDISFQLLIQNQRVGLPYRPHNPESYILLSAGFDGKYGTSDDIFNFEK